MSLRARVFLTMLTLLAAGVVGAASILTWSTRDSLRTQAEESGLVLAQSILRAISTIQDIPDQVEITLGEQMQVQARIVAEYVATAERAGDRPGAITSRLEAITNESPLDEIWVTNEKGEAYLTNNPGPLFTFSPDPEEQPQASEFWPLLTGESEVVIQDARLREIGGIYKYVGVTGVDKPRIVQVTNETSILQDIERRTGVQTALESAVAGENVRAIWLFDSRLEPVADAAAEDEAGGVGDFRVELAREAAEAKQARSIFLGEGAGLFSGFVGDRLDVYAPLVTATGELELLAVVRLPTARIQEAVGQVVEGALLVVGLVLVVSTLLSVVIARRITEPVQVIGRAAQAVEAGNLPGEGLAEVAAQGGELGRLAEVFGSMAHEVRNREERLDTLVKERTAELERSNADLQNANETMSGDLEMARALQRSLVVRKIPESAGCEVYGYMDTAQQVGGDFYEVFQLSDTVTVVGIADVSGKGAAAALFMAAAKPTVERAIRDLVLDREGRPNAEGLARAISRANRELCVWNSLSYFVTALIAVFDSSDGKLHYVNAGHENPYLLPQQGAPTTLKTARGVALGVDASIPYEAGSVDLKEGDRIFLFTDGFTEAMDPDGEWFGGERLAEALGGNVKPDLDGEKFVSGVLSEVRTFTRGAQQSDDITCVTLRYIETANGELGA